MTISKHNLPADRGVGSIKVLSVVMAVFIAVMSNNYASAQTINPTIYSDGLSCPNNCDSHVVLHPSRNGTIFAHDPQSSRRRPQACSLGKPCRVCFSQDEKSCLVVTYRGNGPPRDKFDFTPAFYQEFCRKDDIPNVLIQKCKSFEQNLNKLTKNKVYCVSDPQNPVCRDIISKNESMKSADKILRDECISIGQSAFNIKYASDRTKQRSEACAYEKFGTGGPNSQGVKWRRLLPAACYPGTYSGRDGLDCCDTNMMSVGGLGLECTPFLVNKPI